MTRTCKLISPMILPNGLKLASDMKYLYTMFHHHPASPKFSSVIINGCLLNDALWLERLLGIIVIPDFKWVSYTRSIAKDNGEMPGALCFSRKFFTPPPMVCLYNHHFPVFTELGPCAWLIIFNPQRKRC